MAAPTVTTKWDDNEENVSSITTEREDGGWQKKTDDIFERPNVGILNRWMNNVYQWVSWLNTENTDRISEIVTNTTNITTNATNIGTNTTAIGLNTAKRSYPVGDESKLDGIAAGAEVNVQSDWDATTGDALILNKPTIATATYSEAGTGVTYMFSSRVGDIVTNTFRMTNYSSSTNHTVTFPTGYTFSSTNYVVVSSFVNIGTPSNVKPWYPVITNSSGSLVVNGEDMSTLEWTFTATGLGA